MLFPHVVPYTCVSFGRISYKNQAQLFSPLEIRGAVPVFAHQADSGPHGTTEGV